MKYFNNFKEAHEYYKYPSTHRIGTIGDDNGVIRSYSNGKNCDYYKNDGKIVFYKIKNVKIKELFLLNKKHKKKVRFFMKVKEGVKDMGLYTVKSFTDDNYVILLVLCSK